MNRIWKLLPLISAPMPWQMAYDEILFRDYERKYRAGEALSTVIRFFTSSDPWVSIGYAYADWTQEKGKAKISSGILKRFAQMPVCRRLTGGGVVFHEDDLMFSIIADKSQDESFGSVKASYLKIHEAVKRAFEMLGRKPRFYRCEEELPRGESCFDHPIATDLAIKGKKVAGGGQKRSGGVLLHQESVVPGDIRDHDNFRAALIQSISVIFNVSMKQTHLDPETLRRAQLEGETRYRMVAESSAF